MERIGLQAILEDQQFMAGLARYTQGLARAESVTDRSAGVITRTLGGIGGTFQRVGEIASGVLLARGIEKAIELGSSVASVGFEFLALKETSQAAFETMIGDAEKARALMADIQKFSAETPFELPELNDASKKLLAFNVAAEDVVPTLRRIGDISSGIGAPIGEIAELYGKAKVQGRLFMEDINQLTGRGIPIIQELAKQFGVSDAQVRELVEDGKVGFPNLEKAFISLTSKGGKFAGMMEKQSKTFKGMFSTLKDTFAQTSARIVEPFFEMATEWMEKLIEFTNTSEFNQWVDNIADGVSSIAEIIRMLATGDFRGGIFGLTEDSPWIDALLTARDTVIGLFNALSKGDWGGAWKAITDGAAHFWEILNDQIGDPGVFLQDKLMGALNGIKDWLAQNGPATWNTLVSWGESFWNWIEADALPALGGKLNQVRDGITTWLDDNGPAAWTQLQAWATDFWDWLTGTNGALWQARDKIIEVAKTIAAWLDITWKNTVAPTLLVWASAFWDWVQQVKKDADARLKGLLDAIHVWATSENTKTSAKQSGEEVGRSIAAGINNVLSGKGKDKPFGAFALSQALIDAVADLKKQGGFLDQLTKLDADLHVVGKAWGEGLLKGISDGIMPNLSQWIKDTIVPLRDAIIDALQPVLDMFKTISMGPAVTANPSGIGGINVPNVLPSLPQMGASGGIGTITIPLQVQVGADVIDNRVLTLTYDAVQKVFTEATASATSGQP